ncbi:hypothetical protein X975_13763, partial [Stegodyphus mimosarum]
MELTREHFHAIIFHNFRHGLSRLECFCELNSLYSDKAPFYSTVKKHKRLRREGNFQDHDLILRCLSCHVFR